MVTYSNENILSNIQPYSVILHQVDCKGNTNYGLAKQINSVFNDWYLAYRSYCKWFNDGHEDEIFGTFHRFEIKDKNIIVCSAFCQQYSSKNFIEVDLDAWRKVLDKILRQTEKINTIQNKNWVIHIQNSIGSNKKTLVNSDLIDMFKCYFEQSDKATLVIHQ